MFQKVFLPLVCILIFISCSSDDDFSDELNANIRLWQSSQIKNYKWNERIVCGECSGVFFRDVFVVNNSKDTVVFNHAELVEGQTYEDIFNDARTVQESFNFIKSLLNQNVAFLNIEYNETYGFPTDIDIDYDRNAVDDEGGYIYTDFEITN